MFVDRVIMLPRLEGPRLPGLPHDDDGFIPVDVYGRVAGSDDIYAAGDVTAFPLKQGAWPPNKRTPWRARSRPERVR